MKPILQLLTVLILSTSTSIAQKKSLEVADFDKWNSIQGRAISANGKYVLYSLERGEQDNFLKIQSANAEMLLAHDRAESGQFTYDSEFAVFKIGAWADSLKEMKRRKVKKSDMPKDTLGIFYLKDKKFTKIPNVMSFKIPEKWSGFVAYQLDEIKAETKKEDPKNDSTERKKGGKKVGKESGYHLVIRNLKTEQQDTVKYVTDYNFSERGSRLAFVTTGYDDRAEGVYLMDLPSTEARMLFESKKAKYSQLSFSETGKNLAFVVDQDTTKALLRSHELYHWTDGNGKAKKMLDNQSAPQGYRVSENGSVYYSEDDSRLYFGLATAPILQDTSLLDEEIVNVEVWSWDEPVLYTMQETALERDRRRSYTTLIHLSTEKLVQIGSEDHPNVIIADEGNAPYALASTSEPYSIAYQWTGRSESDYYLVDVTDGSRELILKKMSGRINISPEGRYVYGYSNTDTSWYVRPVQNGEIKFITKGRVFYDELNDRPDYPRSYGLAGWTHGDKSVILRDRYDLWEFDPATGTSTRLTKGRETQTTYNYVRLDREERSLEDDGKWLLTTFNEKSRDSGFAELNRRNDKMKNLLSGPYLYSPPVKAELSDEVIYTRQSFREYPDIQHSDLSFKSSVKISNANPQQKDYNWGSAEIVDWTSLDGMQIEGMLFKPDNFDPTKKYPMIVYFYERSSNGIHAHRTPTPRGSINYTYYTSRGYLVFNPDIYYQLGYPGESAYNCIIPGITSLIDKGFVDKDNIGVQGHSWGGYQIAYMVTRTTLFKAAESGAPVVNMFSAYGGIRWGSGMSRQFQYEHTQSRIGGTPWEYPIRYIENSPLFSADKIETPLLILHNDADTAVPWYQGIEFFTALRRLGKPAWLVNYNGEPHGIRKRQNRVDFNIRMSQFFDHYLKGAPMPSWMKNGVPAIEKGINQGFELIDNK